MGHFMDNQFSVCSISDEKDISFHYSEWKGNFYLEVFPKMKTLWILVGELFFMDTSSISLCTWL